MLDEEKIVSGDVADHTHEHEHEHEHAHEHKHEHEHGHDHGHEHSHSHEHGGEHEGNPIPFIIIGAVLLIAGVVLEKLRMDYWFYFTPLIIAYVLLAYPVILEAAEKLINGNVFNEDFLMVVASVAAICIKQPIEAVGVMLFFRVGEWFEDKAIERSRKHITGAIDMRPETVTIMTEGGSEVIDAGTAKVGDTLIVKPGDRIPLDGTIISGRSRLDTSAITGESVPISVRGGDSVLSGCVNDHGQLLIRVDKPLSESMVTRILRSVEEASSNKPQLERFITKFSRYYTPIVIGLAVLVAVLPPIITGNISEWDSWNYWIYTAISFLVMSCPCALAVSIPLAFFAGVGRAGKLGILFKGGSSIEGLCNVRAIAMDKTGTITEGVFEVQKIELADPSINSDAVLAFAASAELSSNHPIAASVVRYARGIGLDLCEPSECYELAGHGVLAVVDGREVLVGSESLMGQRGILTQPSKEIGTVAHIAIEGCYVGLLVISDVIKEDADEAIADMKLDGLTPVMLTGDNPQMAAAVAGDVGIKEAYAKLLPEDKLELLGNLREEFGPVCFVGDGINDAPVIAGADVGCAMGSGADAAIEAADIVFMNNELSSIPRAYRIATKTRLIAIENVVFALGTKLVVMVLGLLGFASMWAAVFADTGVLILCILNAARALLIKAED